MKIRRLFSIFLTILLTLSLSISSFAMTLQESFTSFYDFALEQIAVIDGNDPNCPWSNETTIDSTIILYNMDQTPNGYIFKLKTGIIESGFIQIHDIDGAYSLYCYAYEGDSEVECMLNYWGTDLDENTHIYFLGSFKYLIDSENGGYLDLSSNCIIERSKDELVTIENNYTTHIEEAPVVLTLNKNKIPDSSTISRGSIDDYTWPITSDFSGITITYNNTTQTVVDHCTPTAATAIVRYLRHLGRTQCSTGESARQTFEEMYIALNTNQIRFNDSSIFYNGDGTARSQIAPGIQYYATQNGYSLSATRTLLPTLSGMKSQLDNNKLLLVSVDDFGGISGGHSIVVTGYSSNTLYVQNGWSRAQINYAYSSLDIAQYVSVGG